MNNLAALLSQPITQLVAVGGILYSLQKAGINVRGIIDAILGAVNENAPSKDGIPEALQALLDEMQQLKQYANHDTTEGLERVNKAVEGLTGKLDSHVRDHDKVMYILEDIKQNGVKCSND